LHVFGINLFKSRGVALVASAGILAVAAGGGAVAGTVITSQDIKDKTIQSADLHKNVIKTQKVKNGTLRLGDLDSKVQAALKKVGAPGPAGPAGPTGPTGPQGPKGDPAANRVSGFTAGGFTNISGNPTVRMTGDGVSFGPYADGGADGGSLVYNGLNGQKLSAVKNLAYYMRYTTTGDSGGVGVPYLRIFTESDNHVAIFSPNTQAPDPDVAEGPFHEWVGTSGTWRYDDDLGTGPEVPFVSLVAAHGNETISRIVVSVGFSNGADLTGLLRWMDINGVRYSFGS
jgi:hypothetical protein